MDALASLDMVTVVLYACDNAVLFCVIGDSAASLDKLRQILLEIGHG